METVLISGANRGLGLALTAHFAKAGWKVLAGCREPEQAHALTALKTDGPKDGNIEIFKLDVTDAGDVSAMARRLGDQPLDVLINNAGLMDAARNDLLDIDIDDWQKVFAVNTMAPVRLALGLKDQLCASANPRIVTISSQMGALSETLESPMAYGTSKAAVNKAMKALAARLADDGVIVCPLHPGWVQTDMGGPQAAISPEESAEGIFDLTVSLTQAMSGRFWTWDGTEHPW